MGRKAVSRRRFLQTAAAGMTGLAAPLSPAQATAGPAAGESKPTRFQVACMTLPYARFPLRRALTGIRDAGYRHVAWGTTHQEGSDKRVPVMPADAAPARAKELAARCRDLGLEPVMMFSDIYPEAKNAVAVLRRRIEQAAAARIPQVLTFGSTRDGGRKLWLERFRALGPIARDHGVLIVIKQHGGATGSGEACARITREVNDDGIRVNYDAGNVMDYLRLPPAKVIADLQACADQVRSFCIKDHRDFPPPHQDCGPGLGEIDHYRLLHLVAFTGRVMPLCCENIFAPRVRRPEKPEGVDALARRAREFLELVIAGVQATT
ncbi:MAG: TIM barrel protein [Planctomycetes bacterium]|nr:TIM barrel protein [Planctomycetota bacterium]